jgi:hypothetical protein
MLKSLKDVLDNYTTWKLRANCMQHSVNLHFLAEIFYSNFKCNHKLILFLHTVHFSCATFYIHWIHHQKKEWIIINNLAYIVSMSCMSTKVRCIYKNMFLIFFTLHKKSVYKKISKHINSKYFNHGVT